MNEEPLYTIAEVAEKLNISKVTVYNKLAVFKKDIKAHVKFKNKVKYIDTKGVELINQSIDTSKLNNKLKTTLTEEFNQECIQPDNNKHLNRLNEQYIIDLKEQISDLKNESSEQKKFFKEELNNKNTHISELTKLLENSQVLLKQNNDKVLLLEEKSTKKWWNIWN